MLSLPELDMQMHRMNRMTLQDRINVINRIYGVNQPEHLSVINELVRRLKVASHFINAGSCEAERVAAMEACDLDNP